MADQTSGNIPGDPRDSVALFVAGAAGDAPALASLLARHMPDLRAFVRLRVDPMLREHESCSDVVQSVCVEILAHPQRFDFRDEVAFRNWLYGAVLIKIAAHREHYLAQKRHPGRVDRHRSVEELVARYSTLFDPVQQAAKREQIERLESAFDEPTAAQREVLTLHRIVGLSHAEIAERLGSTEVATRQVLHRAIAQLAVTLRARREID